MACGWMQCNPNAHLPVHMPTSVAHPRFLLVASLFALSCACQKPERAATTAPIPAAAPAAAEEDPLATRARRALQHFYPWREWLSVAYRREGQGVIVTARYRAKEPEYLPWGKDEPIPGGFSRAELMGMELYLLRQSQPAGSEGLLTGEIVLMTRGGFAQDEIPLPQDRALAEGCQPGKSLAASLRPGERALTTDHEAALRRLARQKDALLAIVRHHERKPTVWTGVAAFPTRTVRVRCLLQPNGAGHSCEFAELKKTITGSDPQLRYRLRAPDQLTLVLGQTPHWAKPEEVDQAMQAILLDQPASCDERMRGIYRSNLLGNFTLRLLDDGRLEATADGLPPTALTRQR